MRCPDCRSWRQDEDEPCEPCSVPGARGILGELGVATTLLGGFEVWRAEQREVVVRLCESRDVTVAVGSRTTTIEAALRELHQGWKYGVETLRYETRADGWVVVGKMMCGQLMGMTIRRRVGAIDVDIVAEDHHGLLDVALVLDFAASLVPAPAGVAAPARYRPPPPRPPMISLEPWSPSTRYSAPPPDEPSLGPLRAGFVRLTGLDLDAKLPDGVAAHSDWRGTYIQVSALGGSARE